MKSTAKLHYSCLSDSAANGRNRYTVTIWREHRVVRCVLQRTLFEGHRRDLIDAGATADRMLLLYAKLGMGMLA